MSDKIIFRNGKDDFEAFLVATGMANAGADVFSIVWTGRDGPLAYIVAAKFRPPLTFDEIDGAIELSLSPPEKRDE